MSCGLHRFRRLALKYHPEVDRSDAARAEFLRVCEAYDVLSDCECPMALYPACVPANICQRHLTATRCTVCICVTARRKGVFDLYGEAGLKAGMPDGVTGM